MLNALTQWHTFIFSELMYSKHDSSQNNSNHQHDNYHYCRYKCRRTESWYVRENSLQQLCKVSCILHSTCIQTVSVAYRLIPKYLSVRKFILQWCCSCQRSQLSELTGVCHHSDQKKRYWHILMSLEVMMTSMKYDTNWPWRHMAEHLSSTNYIY